LSDEVARLRAGGSMQLATIEAKNAFEDLTGFKYENCWGNNNILSANNEQAAIAEIALKDNK